MDTSNNYSWLPFFGTKNKDGDGDGDGLISSVSDGVSAGVSAVTGAANNVVSGTQNLLTSSGPDSGMTGGRRRKSRRAGKRKRSKTVRRRKSRGKHTLPTSQPLHEQTRRLAMGQARAQAQSQSRSLALAGGVRAYSSNEMSSMNPAPVNYKKGSFLLSGGRTKKYRKGKKKGKRGGQLWV